MTSRPARVPGWWIAWTSLLVGLGASVGANVGAARPETGPRLTAAVAPVVALLAAALLERVDLRGTRWWQRAPIAGGLVVVIALAFTTSYQHQQALFLAYGNPRLSADLLPIAVDVLVLMASVALTVIGQQRRTRRAEWEAAREVPAEAPTPAAGVPARVAPHVPAAPPAVVERVDPLGLDDRDVPEPEPEPAGTPEPPAEPVPTPAQIHRRRLVSDQQIVAVLKHAEDVPRGADGKVAVEYVQQEFGVGQSRAIRVLQKAGLHRAKDGQSIPGDGQPAVPAETRELEDAPA